MQSVAVDKLAEIAQKRGRPFEILIVDDERYVREVFRDYCALTNAFQIDLAQGGKDAVDKVSSKKYDLITMDLIMPDVSGLEALTAIKEVSPQVPVIIVTGNATEKLIREAGVKGACRVVYKPVMLEDFLVEIVTILTRESGNM
ncbi:MAG: response regulator [Candidatus Zixiibacteriota bacterium]|jgi:DNA-binding NtrC family response regulator